MVSYLCSNIDLWAKLCVLLIIRSLIRFEVVVSLDDVPSELNVKDINNLGRLESLIDKYPVVVPFKETVYIAVKH